MTFTWAVVVVSGAAVAALIAYFRWRLRNKLFGAREDENLECLWATSNANLPLALFEEVFRSIAKELGVRPGQLRPSDSLDEIFKIDSWRLGAAQDALEDLIRKKTGNRPPSVTTIQDLLTWLANEPTK